MTRVIDRILGESNQLEATAHHVAQELAKGGIPHLIVGGYALNHYGYARFTHDVDVVVPDVNAAREHLSIRGFAEKPGSSMSMRDRTTGIDIDLLPGGKSVGPAVINLPMPDQVSTTPNVVSLEELVSQKLSSFHKNQGSRLKDLGDAQELVHRLDLPRDLAVHPELGAIYHRLWDKSHGQVEESSWPL